MLALLATDAGSSALAQGTRARVEETIRCAEGEVQRLGREPGSAATGSAARLAYATAKADSSIPDALERFGSQYLRFGVSRSMHGELERVADVNGVGLYRKAGEWSEPRPDVLYLLVRPPCDVQPYHDITTLHINLGPPRVATDPLPAYLAVLRDLRSRPPIAAATPLVLSEAQLRWFGDREDPPPRRLSRRVLEALEEEEYLTGTCRAVAERQCDRDEPSILIRLGEVREAADSSFVKVVPADRPQGVTLQQQLEAVSDSLLTRLDLDVDVEATVLCGPAAAVEGCVAEVNRFMYFLRREPDSGLSVVTRWLLDPLARELSH